MLINIIAVDDETDAKILFDHFFRKEIAAGKVNLIFVKAASECLEELTKLDPSSTLVVTDINMPEVDGIQLSERINQKYSQVKIFLVSAYDARSQIKNIKHLQIAEYITKPVDFSVMKEKIWVHYPEVS